MNIIKTRQIDSDGSEYDTYGVELNFREGTYRSEDISLRYEDVELYCDILKRVELPYRDIKDFTADFVNLVNKYPDAKIKKKT